MFWTRFRKKQKASDGGRMEMIYVCSRLLEIRVSLRVPTRGRHVRVRCSERWKRTLHRITYNLVHIKPPSSTTQRPRSYSKCILMWNQKKRKKCNLISFSEVFLGGSCCLFTGPNSSMAVWEISHKHYVKFDEKLTPFTSKEPSWSSSSDGVVQET